MAYKSSRRAGALQSVHIYLAFVLVFASLVHSIALPSPEAAVKIDPKTGRPEEGSCDVKGNADLYGLGVRLGIYFQWLGSFLSNILLPGEISTNLDTNTIFLFALFIAVAKGSFDDSITSIDALILLILAYGYFFSVLSLFGYRTRFLNDGKGVYISTVGAYLRLMLTSAIAGFAVWFWYDGITELKQAPCEEVIFFFKQLEVLGPIRVAFKAASVVFLIYYGTICIHGIITVARYIIFTVSGQHPHHSDLKFWERYRRNWSTDPRNPLGKRGLKLVFYGLRTFNLVYLLWAAITVEMTLNGNHVRDTVGPHGLSSTGQQLPAIIGIFTFLRVLYVLFKEYREKKRTLAEAGEESVGDVKLADLDGDEQGSPVSPIIPRSIMARTMGNADTAYKPVPGVNSVPLD